MSVKRYDMEKEYSLDINVIPVEEEDGAFVKYEEYSALEQKLTDMAVQLANAESKCREQTEFLAHIKKCLVKNGEYAPLSHEEIDTLLGIRADGKGAAL